MQFFTSFQQLLFSFGFVTSCPTSYVLVLIGRHDVVGLADLAGDVILGSGASVASSVQTTLAGATGWKYAACQVQLYESRCSGPASSAQTRRCPAQTSQCRLGGTRWTWPCPSSSCSQLSPTHGAGRAGPRHCTVGLLTLALVTCEPGGDEVKPFSFAPSRQHEFVRIF